MKSTYDLKEVVVRRGHYCVGPSYSMLPVLATYDTLSKFEQVMKNSMVEYDTVVGCGMSGVPFATQIGLTYDKNVCLIRRENEGSSHGGNVIQGVLGERVLFVDDLIDSGATQRHVLVSLKRLIDERRNRDSYLTRQGYSHSEPKPKTVMFVGSYLYAHTDWNDSDMPGVLHPHTLNLNELSIEDLHRSL